MAAVPAQEDQQRLKQRLWLLVKVLTTGALLWYVARGLDFAALGRVLGSLSPVTVALAVLLTYAAGVLSALRWQRVLHYLGADTPLRAIVGDTLVGTTYNLLLPTSIGGDVARAVRASRRIEQKSDAWASVMFERVMGLFSLALFSCFGAFTVASGESGRQLLIASVVATVVLFVALVLAPAPLRLAARIKNLGARSLGGALEQMATSLAGPLSRPAPRLETFFWSVAYQVVSLGILAVAGLDWDEPGLYAGVFLGIPIALVGTALPITIGGFGLRESLFVAVLGLFGVGAERAFALSIIWLASNLVLALTGAAVMATERKTAPPSI